MRLGYESKYFNTCYARVFAVCSFYFVRKSISTEKSPFHWTECEWDSIDSHWERNWSWNQFEQKILPNQNKCERIKSSKSIMNREQNEWRVNFSTTHRYLALLTFVLNHSHAHANNFDTIKTQSYLFLKLVDQKKYTSNSGIMFWLFHIGKYSLIFNFFPFWGRLPIERRNWLTISRWWLC